MDIPDTINPLLKQYVESTVIPRYDSLNLLKTGAFTISIGTKSQMVACDYVGIASGNNVPDKFARAGWHATKSIIAIVIAVIGFANLW